MSAGEVVHTASTGGQKAGNDVRPSLIPAVELLEVAELYGRGAKKYDAHNWTRGYDWSLSYDALQRHLAAFWSGEELDNGDGGTGLQHLSCAAFHVFTLMYFAKHHRALDDRHIAPAQLVGTLLTGKLPSAPPGNIFDGPESKWPNFYAHEIPVGPASMHWVLRRDELPAGTDGLWQSEPTGLVYRFVDGEWWVMDPDNDSEDPWRLSMYLLNVPAHEGPFTSYVAPQGD